MRFTTTSIILLINILLIVKADQDADKGSNGVENIQETKNIAVSSGGKITAELDKCSLKIGIKGGDLTKDETEKGGLVIPPERRHPKLEIADEGGKRKELKRMEKLLQGNEEDFGSKEGKEYTRGEGNKEEVGINKDKDEKEDINIPESTTVISSKGDTGVKGDKGDKGDVGAPGSIRVMGIKGDPGSKGDKGDEGSLGNTGIKGDKGETGARGHDGERGLQGERGMKGDKGDVGMKGEVGIKGDTGDTGIQGPQGNPGLKGDKGNDGAIGMPGERGNPGRMGPRGNQGADGAIGPMGLQGQKGEPGKDCNTDKVTGPEMGLDTPGSSSNPAKTCGDIDSRDNGVYTLNPADKFDVYCDFNQNRVCLITDPKKERDKFNFLGEPFLLSLVGFEPNTFYGISLSQLAYLNSWTMGGYEKIRIHCENTLVYSEETPEISIQLLLWNDNLIGPNPAPHTPVYYKVTKDLCKSEEKYVELELTSPTSTRLPVVDFYIRDSTKFASISPVLLELCFNFALPSDES